MSGAGNVQIPAVVVGGSDNCGGLGVVRSLGQAGIQVIAMDREFLAPALHSRYARKLVVPELNGPSLVRDLLDLHRALAVRPVLFLTSDEAALTVSEHRADLESAYRFTLPSHECLTALMGKNSFQKLALERDFPIPRSERIRSVSDLLRLRDLAFPVVIKPTIKTEDYLVAHFERGYRVASPEEAEAVCRRILPVLADLIVQEWIEGPDSELYFCLQYRGREGTVASFTGRKLSIWPSEVGTTASCTAAPHASAELTRLTNEFFDAVSFTGMGSMEFKHDVRTGRYFMIEPTAGRVDWQEEVATLNGVNIPLAAYCHEIGAEVPAVHPIEPAIWQDGARHWKAMRAAHVAKVVGTARVHDAYWRLSDPAPALFHALTTAARTSRRVFSRRATRRLGKVLSPVG